MSDRKAQAKLHAAFANKLVSGEALTRQGIIQAEVLRYEEKVEAVLNAQGGCVGSALDLLRDHYSKAEVIWENSPMIRVRHKNDHSRFYENNLGDAKSLLHCFFRITEESCGWPVRPHDVEGATLLATCHNQAKNILRWSRQLTYIDTPR